MIRTKLLLGAAIAAFGVIPVAQADQVDVRQSASWDNSVNVREAWSVDVSKVLNIDGSISITGEVEADALAHATLDDKQIIDGNSVVFEDYQNAYSEHGTEGDEAGEPGLGLGPNDPDYTEEGTPHPATYANTVTAGEGTLMNASGNIGLNMAAGDYNLQENAAVISSANTNNGSGAAEAGSFSLQNLYGNIFNDPSAPSATNTHTAELENTHIDNTVSVSNGLADGADGNIGVNAAAGAFNLQKNALVIATVTGGQLAEAAAGTMQDLEENVSTVEDVTNNLEIGAALVGASGNIGVNLAVGVGNLQLNTLTIANALGTIDGPSVTDTGSN